MARAAMTLLNSLEPAQRQQAMFPFDADERTHWHFIPTEMFPRNGLLMRDMNPQQRQLAHDLLKAGLSQRGYLTATSIMDLETVLKALEVAQRAAGPQPPRTAPLERDPEKYFFSIFGTPTPAQNAVGLARRRASRVAALHHRRRHAGRLVAIVLRQQSGGSA